MNKYFVYSFFYTFVSCTLPEIPTVHNNIIIVDKIGHSHFYSIQDAVNYAFNGDTIIVKNGIYNESIDMGEKNVVLCGESQDSTVVISTNGEYKYPPLWCCHGKIMRMTFYNKNDTNQDYSGIDKWAYALHLDQRWGSTLENRTVEFDNCTFINDNRAATIGAGVVNGSNIYFNNCTLLSRVSHGAAFQCHTQIGDTGTSTIHFNNCRIESISGHGMLFSNGRSLNSEETSNSIILYAKNNIVTSIYNNLDKDQLLSIDSENLGNNLEELNNN